MDILEGMRLFFGGLFVLFVPGFSWSYVFFTSKEIDWVERVALSFGLSIAMVPLTIFWLNWLFGVQITLLNTFLAVCGLVSISIAYVVIKRSSWSKEVIVKLKSFLRRDKVD